MTDFVVYILLLFCFHSLHIRKSETQNKQNKNMNRSESSESLLPSTSREPHRQDYQSIGGTVGNQCLYLISDIIYGKMHAIHFQPRSIEIRPN